MKSFDIRVSVLIIGLALNVFAYLLCALDQREKQVEIVNEGSKIQYQISKADLMRFSKPRDSSKSKANLVPSRSYHF